MFYCSNCKFQTHFQNKYVLHMSIHRNIHNFKFPCGVRKCQANFTSYYAFRQHFSRYHSYLRQQKIRDKDLLDLKCNKSLCKKTFKSARFLISHLNEHIKNNYTVRCCFKSCFKSFKNVSSFKSHISRYHKNYDSKAIAPAFLSEKLEKFAEIDISFENVSSETNNNVENENVDLDNITLKMNMTKDIALFTLMLETKCLVPSVTVQKIIEELHILLLSEEQSFSNLFESKLHSIENLTPQQKDAIVDAAKKCKIINPILCPKSGSMSTIHLRHKFLKDHLCFIAPKEIVLGRNKWNNLEHYQYISIKDSLCALLKDKSVIQQLMFSNKTGTNIIPTFSEMMSDVHDGSIFKSNKIFEDKSILQIILYQDAFELVNPLGSAKGNQKLIGVYFTLANFYHQNRSSVEHLQLALLCKEKNLQLFGVEKVFGALLQDLKELESGIVLDKIKVRAVVFCITGDNLGQHYIGGFVQNFSSSNYMCRYCLLKRSDFKKMRVPLLNAEKRSPANYDCAVRNLDTNLEYEGIKSKSIFNDLQYFHVSSPSLPPCIGHDIFEGIVPLDLSLYVDYFVKNKKWFTYNALNNLIKRTHLYENDNSSKPVQFNINSKMLSGNASENWCTLRFFPIIVYNFVDISDNVWKLLLNLREIVEFIVAPKITHAQIAYLKVLIDEYLERRIKLFPNKPLKPKHHYLQHYPELIYQFGPLIRLWTLRFESKHSYFKRVARRCQNYKNITKTLAVKHQLLQSFNFNGTFFPEPLKFNNGCAFHPNLYDSKIQNAVNALCVSGEFFMTDRIEMYGTVYKSGQFLQLQKMDFHTEMGEIQFILINHRLPYILIKHWEGVWWSERGIFAIHPGNTFKLIEYSCLIDFYPLSCYTVENKQFIVLKHKVAH